MPVDDNALLCLLGPLGRPSRELVILRGLWVSPQDNELAHLTIRSVSVDGLIRVHRQMRRQMRRRSICRRASQCGPDSSRMGRVEVAPPAAARTASGPVGAAHAQSADATRPVFDSHLCAATRKILRRISGDSIQNSSRGSERRCVDEVRNVDWRAQVRFE